MSLFGKSLKDPSPQAKAAIGPQKPVRAYYEVFGDTLTQLSFFKHATLLLAVAVLLETLAIGILAGRPPLVIRVDQLGNAQAVKGARSLPELSPHEVNNFTQWFLQLFMAHNIYTYDNDFKKAFSMMTQKGIADLNNYLSANGIIEGIKEHQLNTTLNITYIKVIKDSPEFIVLKYGGNKQIYSYNDPGYFKEVVLEGDVTLMKVERSEKTPWGLLVDSWSMTILKG